MPWPPANLLHKLRWIPIVFFTILLAACGMSNWSGDHPNKNNYALHVSPSAPIVTLGHSIHFTASSPWGGGAHWSVLPASCGTIDQDGNFTASTSPANCTVMAMWQEDVRYTATASVSLVPPATASLTASTINPLFGAGVNLIPNFADAGSAVVGTTRGGNDLATSARNGVAIATTAITAARTYWLRATNPAGDFVDSSVTVTPQIVVVNPISPANLTLSIKNTTTFTTSAINGATDGIIWSATAGTMNPATGVWTAPGTAGTVTITATSNDDPTKSTSTTVTVVSVIVVQVTASSTNPPFGAPVKLTPTYEYAVSATLGTTPGGNDVSISPVSGVPITTAPITTSITFWLRATNAAGDFQDASVTVTPQTVAIGPIAPATPTRTVNTLTTFSTAVTGGATNAVMWSASAGSINANRGVWTAPNSAGNVTITATSADDASKTATTVVNLVPASTAAITASSTNPLFGATVNLTPTFANAVSASIGSAQGGNDISNSLVSGTPIATAPITFARTYWLRTTNAAGDSTDASVTVSPQTVVLSPISPASPTRMVNSSTTFSATAFGGATDGITWSASAGTMNAASGSWTAPGTPGNATITATSQDDSSKTATTTVTVLPLLTASLSASSTNPAYGATVNLTPTFANATSAVVGTTQGGSDISNSPASGTPITTAAITTTKTYWLRATNAAGDFVDSSVTVAPQTVVVNPISPASPTRTGNSSTTFTATATGGVSNGITWSASAGTMNANTGAWTAPSTAGTVTITATSQDDATKTANTTVNVVLAATSSISASSTNPLYGSTVNLTPTFANATSASIGTTQGGNDISSSPVSGTPITTVAITTTKAYWLRATNAAGDFVDSSVTVAPQTVVVNPISPASPTRTGNSSTTFTATATGGVSNGITWSASAGTMNANTGAWTAPSNAGNVTITATSKDDASKSATTSVTVVLAPTGSIAASSTNPLYAATINLTPTFANATTATVGTAQGGSDLSIAPTSGIAIATGPITSTTIYWLRATNAAGDFVDSSVTVTPQTVVVNAISPANPTRTVNSSTNFSTTATGGVTNNLNWSANAGTMNAGSGSWTAPGTAGSVTITATSQDDSSKTATTNVSVVLAPTASLGASSTNPLYGASINLTPTFTNAASAKVGTTQSGSDISSSPTSGTPIATGAITSAKTYWLRATNAAGDFVDSSVTVAPQTVVVNPVNPPSPTVSVNSTTTFTTTITGGVTNGINWSASAGTMNAVTGAWTAPSTAGNVTITATSKDDGSKSAITNVTVVLLPTDSLSASSTTPLYGDTVNLTPTFSNATSAEVGTTQGGSDISSSPTSGTAITTAALTSQTTFWLRATNAAGSYVDNSVIVNPKAVTISGITKSASNVSVGYTATAQATVSNAVDTSVDWTATCGSLSASNTASGENTDWTAPNSPTTCTLTAKSHAKPSVNTTTSITVVALPIATSLTPSTTSPLYGATIGLTPVFSKGTGSVDQGVGTVTNNVSASSLSLTAPTTFTLTITNAAGQSATASSGLITPQTVAVTAPTPANGYVSVSGTQAFSASAQNALNSAVTWSSGGAGSWSGATWTAPSTAGVYTITASSVADPTKSNSTSVNVVALPVIQSFNAADPQVSLNHQTTLTAVFTNGGGNADLGTGGVGSSDVSNSVISNTGVPSGSLSATTTFTLTVYNLAGSSTSATLIVPVVVGSSTPADPLSGAMYDHTSTLLPGGTVFIVGGQNGTTALDTAQLYDPIGPAVSDAGTMQSARYSHTTTLLPNSTVLVAGGDSGGGSTIAESEIWNGSFAVTGSLNTPREKHTATLLQNGMVLIVGGVNGSSPVVSAELYNPSTGTFTYTAGNLNTARYSHTATLLANGQVLIAGGYSGSVPLKSAEIYNPASGAFTLVGSMSTARQRQAAVLLNDGTVAMIGGEGASAPLASVEIFNPSTNTFSITGSMANARDSLTATLLTSGKVVVAGGVNASGVPVDVSEMFDPTAGSFSLTALLASSRSQHTATLLQNGEVLLAGGLSQSGATGTTELIDPQDGLTPTIPDPIITAPVGASTAQTSLTASVPSQTHVQYFWLITGGTITAGLGSRNITFSMPASGTANLDALVVSDRIIPSHASFVVTPLPIISTFAAQNPTVTVGGTATLTWTVQGATSLSIDQNVGSVSGTSTTVTVGSLGTTTYTLTAANAGGSVTATTQVLAVPPPIATSLTAAASAVPIGGNTNLTPIFSQGTGSISPGIGAVSSGPAYPTAAIKAPTTFTLTVTNAAGDTAQLSTTVGLQPVVVTGISGPQYVTSGRTATYAATVTGSVNTSLNWSVSAGSFNGAVFTAPTGSPYNTTQTPVTITATSVNGGAPATFTVQVVPLPVITSFVSTPATADYGGSTTMTPIFSLGSGQIEGLGSVTSGQGVSSGTLTASASFTLTVTNLAGDSVSQNLTVGQNTPSVSTPVPSPANTTVTSGDQIHFTATTNGSANTAVTWTATGGSFSGNLWTAPAAGSYTITAHSVSPAGYSASILMTVVSAPSIASFSASATSIASGGSVNLLANFSNGAATVNPGGVSPVSGVPFSSGALTSTATYTLTVTNAAGRSTTIVLTINVVQGIFNAGSNLIAGRVGHTVTLLADGRVLIAGGSSTATAEISDGQAQNITANPAMQSVRFYHTATLLANGYVLVAGGADNTGTSQITAELFNPATKTFAATGTMNYARQKHSAAIMKDGRVLLAGGVDDSGNVLSSAEIYDPTSGTFSMAPDMTELRESSSATPLEDGRLLVAGGDDGSTPNSTAQDFDGTAFTNVVMDYGRAQHTATLMPGGSVFLAGGTDLSTALSTADIYNAGSFSPGPALSPARYGHTGNLLASGLAMLAGGSSDGTTPLSSAVVYDPTISGYWSTGSLSIPRFEPASTILRNGHVLVSGGSSNPTNVVANALNTNEVYDPQDNLTPILPSASLTAPTSASDGATGLTAYVPSQNNVLYIWSLTNGTITAGLNTHAITFSISTAPSVLSVLVISDRQVPVQSSVTINPAPTITSFTATPSTNTTGLATTLAWSASGGSGLTLSINNGVGDVSQLTSTTVITPASNTTYTLTATDSNGTVTRSVTLTAVPMPTATALTAAVNPVEKGSSTTIVPVFSANQSASIDHGIGTVTSGLAYPTGIINSATTFTLTSTNTVGTSATISTTVNVMPVVVGAISGPSNVTVGSSSRQYSTSVTGAVDTSVTWSVSAGSITSAGVLTAPLTPQDIVVTATSVADPSQHNQTTVHVVPVALALSIAAAVNPVLYGGTTTVTPTFSQGTGTIDQGIGSVSSGVAYTTGTITANKTFTLTVTNASGDSATAQVIVQPQAVVVSAITGPSSGNVTQGHTASFSATVSGAVDTSLTWSSGGAGSWSGATWTAPNATGGYTITATAVNGSTNTLTVTVVAAPAISAFAGTPPGINKNQSSVLTASFTGAGTGSNANGIVTPGNLTLGSGTLGESTGALPSSQTYTLTVTNDAGDSATAQTTVQVFLGQFSATSNSLATTRNLPTATLQADGNVMVAGGGSGSATVDEFDGTALTFASATPLLTGRNGHTATLLPNGLILIAGGSNGSTTLATAELYNPASGSVSYTGSMAHARQNHRAILLDSGKVLVLGGVGLSSAETYDPTTGIFSSTNPMASVRESATVSRLPDGRILVAGGSNGGRRLATAEIYDPSTNSFSTAASMLAARQLHTATTLPSGQILIVGGTGSTGSGSAEIFNPSLMRFVSTGNMIQPRQEHVAILLAGGMVLLAGGNNGSTPNAIDQAELFDPSNGTFQKTDFMSNAGLPATGAAGTILASGQVLVTGGTSDGTTAVPGSEIYTPTDGISAPSANANITAQAYVPQGATGVSAHVTAAAGARYVWMVSNGTLVSGQGTSSITLNMPATGNVTVDVLILSSNAVPSHGQAVIVGEPAPVISSFTAAPNPVPYGGSSTLTPVFSNATASAVIGTGASGSSDVTASAVSGSGVQVGTLNAATQYRITLTNRAGVSVNQTVTVGVQSVIVSAITPTNPTVSAEGNLSFSASVSNAVDTGIVWSTTGGTIDPATGSWTAPSAPGSYTITATAAADGVTSSFTTATVVSLPAITSFTASPSTVNFGQSSSLTAVFTGASGNQALIGTGGPHSSQLTSSAASGNPVSTGALSANTTYTLTVTNAAGASTTATAQVIVTQPFSATGSMSYARLGQTTTLLADGTVLIAGGSGGADPGEIYIGGSFTATAGNMTAARANHTATLLANGTVLLAGGSDVSGNALNTAELYDPTTGSFTATTGAMTRARKNHIAALLPDGTVLIAGGCNASSQQLSDAEIFNPATGTFTVTGPLASARQFSAATTLDDGRVLIAGGFNGTAYLSTAQIFANGSFNPEISMGIATAHQTVTLLPSGHALIAGGYNGTGASAAGTIFVPGTPDAFSVAGSMAGARESATATLLANGNVLVAGGGNGAGSLATAELFNPPGSAFVATGNMTVARSGASSVLLTDGTVLVDGGTSDGTTPLALAEIFNPQDGSTPFQPDATVTASVTHAYAQAAGLTASAPEHSGNVYIWTVQNGTITAGQGTSAITFSMAGSGDAAINLLAVSDHGVPAHGVATVTSDPLPQLISFNTSTGTVAYGGAATLTAVFANANPVTLGTSGYGSSDISSSVTSGQGIVVGPLIADTTYTLTLPTANGAQTSASLTVHVSPVVISSISPSFPTVTSGHSLTFSASVTQALNTSVTWNASGGVIDSSGNWTAPSTPGTYSITATAAADGITSSSTSATVIALPVITSFSTASGTVNYNQSTILTPVFTAPSGSVATIGTSGQGSSQISSSATSGIGISSGALAANTTFTLTVTNSSGDSVTQSLQVSVISPFSVTGSMALARSGQTTTPLADGTVLVAGGTGAADVAEVYSASSSSFFSTTSHMLEARKYHAATLLADGRVLLTGGFDGTNVLSSAEIFDPTASNFTATVGNMLHARQHHASALLSDGRVLVIGGYNSTEKQLVSAEIFDPATGTFTDAGSSLQQARAFATATTLPNGDVLVAGGNGTNGTPLASAELFTEGVFLPQSFPMTSARSHHTATLLTSGQVLLAGGFDGSNVVASVEIYSGGSSAGSFAPITGSMIAAREWHSATVLASGKVLLAGGTNGSSTIGSAEIFDPNDSTFTAAGNMVTPRFGAGATLLQSGTIVIEGGRNGSVALASAEIFNPQDGLTPTLDSLGLIAPDAASFGSTQNASIQLPTGARCMWWVENGTLDSTAAGTLEFNMGLSGNTTIHVLVYTDFGLPIMSSADVVGQ